MEVDTMYRNDEDTFPPESTPIVDGSMVCPVFYRAPHQSKKSELDVVWWWLDGHNDETGKVLLPL